MTPPGTPGEFPHAPHSWSPGRARAVADEEGLALDEDHWEIVRSIQVYFHNREANAVNVRELLDALNEKFHHRGGLKFLYRLLPGGPVAQGCRLAGYPSPPGSVDRGFGSVQ